RRDAGSHGGGVNGRFGKWRAVGGGKRRVEFGEWRRALAVRLVQGAGRRIARDRRSGSDSRPTRDGAVFRWRDARADGESFRGELRRGAHTQRRASREIIRK